MYAKKYYPAPSHLSMRTPHACKRMSRMTEAWVTSVWSSERRSGARSLGPYGRLQTLREEKGLWCPLGERE